LFHRQPGGEADSNRETFADTYHGKVVSLNAARRLITINREINLTNLEQVIPYARARDLVLHHPTQLAALECPCRSARPNPCLPLDVCLVVGEPFASLVVEHHPHKARRITAAEATAILEAEHERGHVHHAFFKDAMMGRFYALCNCCACCCGAMQAWRNGIPMLAASGYVARVEAANCMGCGVCVDVCQFGVLALEEGLAVIDPAGCMGCGLCVDHCPQEALSLRREPARGMPLELDELLTQLAAYQGYGDVSSVDCPSP
jgi:NAD-dependent dihydropyrimidine dehydrogenase PreA subunit